MKRDYFDILLEQMESERLRFLDLIMKVDIDDPVLHKYIDIAGLIEMNIYNLKKSLGR